MKCKLILLILIFFVSCNRSPIDSDIKISNIDVYYVPFHITSMASSTTSGMKMSDCDYIKKENKIKQIKKELLKLKPISGKLDKTNIHLVCDFYNDKGENEFTLICDSFDIEINNKLYKKNDKLIDLLISNSSRY